MKYTIFLFYIKILLYTHFVDTIQGCVRPMYNASVYAEKQTVALS